MYRGFKPGPTRRQAARTKPLQLQLHFWDRNPLNPIPPYQELSLSPADALRFGLVSFCRETRKLLLRQGLTISRTIRPQTDFAGACESRSHKAVCAVRCPGWFVIGSIYRPQLMQEQI